MAQWPSVNRLFALSFPRIIILIVDIIFQITMYPKLKSMALMF